MAIAVTFNHHAFLASALAEDIIEILSNDRSTYEAVTGELARVNGRLNGGDPGAYGELIRELLVRLFRREGIDPDRCSTLLDTLMDRLLSLVDWREVGEHFTAETTTTRQAS